MCCDCKTLFPSETDLEKHVDEHHTIVPDFKNDDFNPENDSLGVQCSPTRLEKESFDETSQKVEVPRPKCVSYKLFCSLCKKKFQSEHILWTHVTFKHGNRSQDFVSQFCCDSCKCRFNSLDEFNKHSELVNGHSSEVKAEQLVQTNSYDDISEQLAIKPTEQPLTDLRNCQENESIEDIDVKSELVQEKSEHCSREITERPDLSKESAEHIESSLNATEHINMSPKSSEHLDFTDITEHSELDKEHSSLVNNASEHLEMVNISTENVELASYEHNDLANKGAEQTEDTTEHPVLCDNKEVERLEDNEHEHLELNNEVAEEITREKDCPETPISSSSSSTELVHVSDEYRMALDEDDDDDDDDDDDYEGRDIASEIILLSSMLTNELLSDRVNYLEEKVGN